jgi:hypothetical protein
VKDQARDLPGIRIVVTDHARERARERFPGFKAARIVDEVRVSLRAGRFSKAKPPGWIGGGHREASLYVWTEDGERIYAIVHTEEAFFVATTVRAFVIDRRGAA